MSASGQKLLAVAVLSRHGARNPFPFPVTRHDVTGDAQMNDLGHEMMRRLGQRIREAYYQPLLINAPPAAGYQIVAKSSPSSRCIQSSSDVLQGLCPESKVLVEEEPVLAIAYVPETPEFIAIHKTFTDVIADAVPDPSADQTNESQVPILVMQHCDNLKAWLANGNPLPDTMSPQLKDRMSEYSAKYFLHNYLTDSIRRSYAEPVLRLILSDLKAAASFARPAILLYNTHDVMMDIVMQEAVGHLPEGPAKQPFAASLTFELIKDNEEEEVINIWYNKQVDLFPGELMLCIRLEDFQSKFQ